MRMIANYYTIIAVVLFSSSVMAEQATCTRYGFDVDNPGVSCADIYDKNPTSHGKSGYYIVKTADNKHTIYCDMELECSGHKGGWMKIADYDTSRGDDCPKGWIKITANNIDVCRSPRNSSGCYSTNFFVKNIGYNKICGKVRGYQKGAPDAFTRYSQLQPSVEGTYVDGISVTLGSPRKHVWTYAIGLSDNNSLHNQSNCPCAKYPGRNPPAFIGSHYYCESGNIGLHVRSQYYMKDPLWDGSGCTENNNCCTNADQPWFFRQLVMKRQDDIEARLCTNQGFDDEGILIEQIQLYVQ